MRRNGLWIIALLLASIISFWQGAMFGAQQITLGNSAGEAMISALHAKWLKDGKVDEVIPFFDIEVDAKISNYGYFLEHDHSWVLWPFMKLSRKEDRDKYMAIAVKYRLEHPYDPPKTELASDKSLRDLMAKNEKEHEMYFAKMMSKYAPQHNN